MPFNIQDKNSIISKISVLLMMLIGFVFLHDYLHYNFHLLLGLFTIAVTIRIDKQQKSYRLLYGVFFFFVVLFFFKITFFYFLLWVFCVLASIELLIGKINHAPLLACFLISPIFDYINAMIGFPIRIQLAEMVINVLHLFIEDISAQGNIIVIRGESFSVDNACAGLKTLGFSYAISLILLSFHERKYARSLRFFSYVYLLLATLILVIIANGIRIALLVLFQIPEGTISHETFGIIAVIVYILTPLYFGISYIIKNTDFWFVPNEKTKTTSIKKSFYVVTILFTSLVIFGFRDALYKEIFPENNLNIPGKYAHDDKTFGVKKLSKKDVLIYIKPPVQAYQLEHSPTICWQGSGFKFHQIENKPFCGTNIYFGTLKNESKTMYTAWFFDNGKTATTDPFEWRWLTIKGEPGFSLINITATSPNKLEEELTLWLNK